MKNKAPSAVDIVRLGPTAASVKAQVKPRKWRKIVKIAHRQGYTVAGALSDAPAPLKERSNAGIREQARKTVKAAYKPSLVEINHAQKRADAIDAKRAADHKVYTEWLTTQAGLLDAQARAADTALLDRQREIAQQSVQAWDDAHAQAQQNAAQVEGTVSDPSQAQAFDFSAAAKASSDLIANQRQTTASMIGTNQQNQGIVNSSLIAQAAAMAAQRMAAHQDETAKLQAEKAKVRTKRAGDIAEEIGRLQDLEVNKANTNREFLAATQKLGIDAQTMKFDMKKWRAEFGLKKDQLNLEKWKEQNDQLWQKAQLQLGYDQIAERQGKAAADRALKRWIAKYNASHGGSDGSDGPTAGEKENARKTWQLIETGLAEMNRLNEKWAVGYIDHKGEKNDVKFRTHIMKHLPISGPMIDLINDLRANDGKLSDKGYRIAKNLGVAKYYERVKLPKVAPHPDKPLSLGGP